MKKRICTGLLLLALAVSLLSGTALAAGGGSLQNFQRTGHYDGRFADVPAKAWYAENVAAAFEMGLVNGSSPTRFAPEEQLSLGQAITLAARLHSGYYNNGASFAPADGAPWYQGYVDYAAAAGMIQKGQFSDYDAPATRGQFAVIFAGALPEEALPGKNTVAAGAIPDVPAKGELSVAVYRLYRAGILSGSDSRGSFLPDSTIRRSEVAAIVTRMADASLRVSVNLPGSGTTPAGGFSLDSVPAYSGSAFVPVNGNMPYFTAGEKNTAVFETYSPLDSLGRCGAAYANICLELMPTEDRGDISKIYPSGWYSVKYDCVPGKYLYNRCHLIGYQLAAENANRQNLITGTRYLNVTGMLPFENLVADHVQETRHHVLYRVTPEFSGSELVARGVRMEAWCVEDKGEEVCFHVFCYNVQPGVVIDYATGDSWLAA